jgi:predicted site-specific integrase-resolvase
MPKISLQEASDLLGVHPDTLRRWEEESKITAFAYSHQNKSLIEELDKSARKDFLYLRN